MSEEGSTVGDLFCSGEEMRVEWKIEGFSTLSDEVDASFESPDFAFSDGCWYLKIYPNGQIEKQSEGHIGLYVVKREGPKVSLTYSSDFKRADGGRMSAISEATREFEKMAQGWGWNKSFQRSELLNSESDLLPSDVLTVHCTLKRSNGSRPIAVSLFNRLMNLSCSLSQVRNEEKWTDVVLKLKGQKFKVHSAILKNRPNMLIDDLNTSNVIYDVQPDVFEHLLSYIYCGRGEDLTDQNVRQLYSAAKKYDIEELKNMCTTYMEENMSDRLFCDTLYVADSFQEKRLTESVMKYFGENSARIMKTEEWKKFHTVNLALAFHFLAFFTQENALNKIGKAVETSVECKTVNNSLISKYSKVGELTHAGEEIEVEWKIAGFSALSDEVDAWYKSPDFCFSDARWYLKIYPNGESKSETNDNVGLYITKKDGPKMSVCYTLDFKRAGTYGTSASEKAGVFEGSDSGWCWDKSLMRSEVENSKCGYLASNVLTVRCRLKVEWKSRPVEVSLFERLLNLSRNLKQILVSEDSTDIVLMLDGREFNAHRAILERRSEVFAAMLRHDMEESRTGVINIEDVQEDMFEGLLSYMYCARGEDLTDQNVRQVYVAADKYGIGELRHLCTAHMIENMSDRLFSDALFVADTFQDTRLKEATMKYFKENSVSILETDEWKKFIDENNAVALQFFTSFAKEIARTRNYPHTRRRPFPGRNIRRFHTPFSPPNSEK